ncbi:MAG: hypothetical protein EA379_01415 [Phycisphaerales bacterium]|nr:MAG: hypothetical protein EA379_01415 [Phycisphaerales bacterium]
MRHDTPPTPTRPLSDALAPSIALGFATAAAMWTLGFYLRIPGLPTPAPLIAGLLILTLLAGGAVAGRCAPAGQTLRYGLGTGLVSGLINLLVLFSLVADADNPNALHAAWPIVLSGWLVFSAAAGAAGATIGARTKRRDDPLAPRPDWHARFAIIAAATVLPLVTIGGLVTSKQAGLAVPDWPNSYGSNMFLFPLSRMTGGIYYEHAHRLFGSLVGLTTMALMIWTLLVERRAWFKWLVVGAFLLVVVQGIMGGLRVTGRPTLAQEDLEPSTLLAFVHGVTGQLYFALMCVIAAMASRRWKSDEPRRAGAIPGSPRLVTTLLLLALVVQLSMGALARHYTDSAGYMHALMTHLTNSVLVFILAIGVGVRAPTALPGERTLRILGKGVMHTAILQMILGVFTLWVVLAHRGAEDPPLLRVLIATSHQTLGAALLALAALAWAWSFRLVAPARPGVQAGEERTRPMPGAV